MNRRFTTWLVAFSTFCPSAWSHVDGPDVIVGDIPDVSNYTTGGAVSGKRAYAIGTTSCNLGDTPLTWIDCGGGPGCNQHPVISQNMYRLANGRFEQIGQAWLKHGFCALQGTVCSSCTPGGNCDALFPGCSDPYSSGLNGSQGGLGPKAEVNASTGAFPYPWLNNGSGSGALFKRLQVVESELTTAGGLYFVSSMYVQPEDAAYGNDNNNESYRRVTIGGAPAMDLVLQGSTQRERPGIFAWRDNGGGVGVPDLGVYLIAVDVPGDGRFWLGSKATDLGGGQWHYEYAIMNLNSDRSGQAFTIPIPAGSTVTNVGFRDVDYHSGEPYSLTDWTSNVTGTSVSWATQTFAQNQNANALRWDTIYNYRFDCNRPPSAVQATLGLFKSGSPTSVTGAVAAPSPDGVQHPFNDSCSTALPIGNGATAFNTAGATTDGPAEPGGCVIGGYNQIGADIWYIYTAACAGSIDVRTCGSTFDTKIAVYNGPACPTVASQIACSDDSATCGSGSLQSQLTFTGVVGNTYLIRLGGYNALTGTGTITIGDSGCGPQPPANDACANAIWLADNVAQNGTTINATLDGTASCGLSSSTPDVWYKYRPVTSATVNLNTCGSAFDTVLSVHSACGGAQLACNDDNGNGGNNACGGGLSSGLNLAMTAGTTYWIRISGYNGLQGNFVVRAVGGGGAVPPANDDCANRAGIALGATAFSTAGAATDGIAHALCNQNGFNNITNDIWYNHPSLATGNLTISTCGTANFNSRIAIYDGAGCTNLDARLLACSDNACSTQAEVVVPVVNGQNYTIRLGGTNGATGSGSLVLSISGNTPPSIAQHPSNATACVGASAGFSVTATGTAPLSYQWRRGTTNLTNGGNISGATSATLTINPVGTGDAGTNYNCVVTNVAGSATSNNASLTVNTPPSITGHPGDQTVNPGGTATFTVGATGTGPLTYQWRRGATNLVNGGNISGATSPTLTINPVGSGDAATNYNCVVSGVCSPPATSNNASLTVPCPADLNGDNQVDVNDLAILLAHFGIGSGATAADGDMNADGDVDIDDLSALLARFGATC